MELLEFFLTNLFYFLHIPMPAEVCSEAETIKGYCAVITGFSFGYFFVGVALVVAFAASKTAIIRKIIFTILSVISAFYFSDITLKSLVDESKYGLDAYFILYYGLNFLLFNLFLLSVLFQEKLCRKLFVATLVLSLIATPLLGLWGRGVFEAIAVITGTYFLDGDVNGILLGFTTKYIGVILLFGVVFALIEISIDWVKQEQLYPSKFYKTNFIAIKFAALVLMPVSSIFIGNFVNQQDISKAQKYIVSLKKTADKYYLENGEYPKIMAEYIEPQAQSPWLLGRHEYFSLDIKGSYYFSRADKYCFIFQNPAQEYGYYSITSTRDWRFDKSLNGFDNVYLALCDERDESFENLIANRMGLRGPDDVIGKMAIETNSLIVPATSKKNEMELHKKIIKYGEKDPEIFKYYGNAPEKYKKIFKQGDRFPASEQVEK